MKIKITIILILAIATSAFAQKNKSTQTTETVREKKVVEQALKYADMTTAISSMRK